MAIKSAESGPTAGGPPTDGTARVQVSSLGDRYRNRLRDLYLAAQRRRWPLPRPIRRMLRALITRAAYPPAAGWQISLDAWPDPAVLGRPSEGHQAPSTITGPRFPESTAPANSAPFSGGRTGTDATPRLRCLVTTGTLFVGGLEMVAIFLARGLSSHGFDTVLAHTPLPDSEGAQTSGPAANSVRLDGLPLLELSEANIQQWLETHRPDVISMHSPPDWLLAAATAARVPRIQTLHGPPFLSDRGSLRAEQLRSRQITGFVAVSEGVRRHYLIANPAFPADRIITIPNGIDGGNVSHGDRTKARAWLRMREEFLFVSLARYTLQKNTYGLVTAFKDVARAYPEAHLLIAGGVIDPSYYDHVRRLRDTLPCAGQIHLCGPCPDVPAVLAAADAFVLDSFFEGGPLASMEALRAGLPVVISDVGTAREQVGADGRGGFLVPNPLADPDEMDWESAARARFSSQVNRAALVKAMCTVVAERERWREARNRLQADAALRFSADVCLRRHAAVLKGAIGSEDWSPRDPVPCAVSATV